MVDYNDSYGSDNEEQVCKVYDRNDFFTMAVQMVLAFMALASLYLKRMQEVPQRTLRTWSLDISKQAIGACYAHVLNMIIAAVISQNIRGESKLEDQCAWYGMSYIIDTSLGLVIAILLLKWLDRVSAQRQWKALEHSGVYVGEDAVFHWMAQVGAWLTILSIAKVIIYVFMWVFSSALAFLGALLFAPLQSNIRFELVFVMILFPGFCNVLYFWIADGFLKAKDDQVAAHVVDNLEDKREALVTEQELPEGQYSAKPWSSLAEGEKQPPSAAV